MRGVTADVIILEEAAFINRALFFEVIVPLMGVRGVAVLAISTPSKNDNNYYSFLMELQAPDTNAPLFKTIRIGLACDACVAADKASSCGHKAQFVPPWKSSSRQEKMQKIMESDQHLFMRENLGMLSNDTQFMFAARYVKALVTRTPPRWQREPHVVFTSIDPSGGGTQSDYAMASVYMEHGHTGIVALDHSGSGFVEDVNHMIVQHVRSIRKLPGFEAVCIVIYIEANMSWLEADRVARLCSQPMLQPVILESKDTSGKGRVGVITDESNKIGYVNLLRGLMEEGRISYAPDMIGMHLAESKAELENQLRSFKRAIKAPDNPEHTKYKVTLTGKGYGRKDDLAMALMMVCYWATCTMGDTEFQALCVEKGWLTG